MSVVAYVIASFGLLILGSAFMTLAKTNHTEELYLRALEYGFALAFLVSAIGLVLVAALTTF
ncbi:hypothetical protein [Natranaeroarchaeum sulfidigenes]|uniref:Uncharacterized protein n=1 Tax=Natranaeroarchaeum sulfidigenes TaxID=2784880 RepID=A0A897MSQ3_9EURY|nr:hypothetical protein [Natranaeroarchaeum sulfidigenes]QSG03527.1 hypothetical protein AArcS_2331 [Natranaeroarchaeum sulfidigenes]